MSFWGDPSGKSNADLHALWVCDFSVRYPLWCRDMALKTGDWGLERGHRDCLIGIRFQYGHTPWAGSQDQLSKGVGKLQQYRLSFST